MTDPATIAERLDCADVDYDQAIAEHRQHVQRGARALIARTSRLTGAGPATHNELEGLRVELLSYRDSYRADLTDAAVAQLQRGAYQCECAKRRLAGEQLDETDTRQLVDHALQTLARFPVDDPPGQQHCARCGQAFIARTGSTRCQPCDQADADQGDQLGMFDLPPTQPRKTARRDQPQPQGLFS